MEMGTSWHLYTFAYFSSRWYDYLKYTSSRTPVQTKQLLYLYLREYSLDLIWEIFSLELHLRLDNRKTLKWKISLNHFIRKIK